MKYPAMLSEIRVTGMPSFISSQAVSRAPWSQGRVSSAKTRMFFPGFVGGADDAQRRAVAGRGQAAGIAVGKDGGPFPDNGGTVGADRPADRQVFLFDADRLLPEDFADAFRSLFPVGFGHPLHPLDGPEEVHRRRAGRGHDVADIGELLEKRFVGVGDDVAGAQGDPHGRGHADGRGPTDHHAADRFGHALEIAVFVVDLFAGKPGLVDHDDLVVAPFYGSKRHGKCSILYVLNFESGRNCSVQSYHKEDDFSI